MATRRASDRDPELDKPAVEEEPEVQPVALSEPAEPAETGHPLEYVRARHPQTGDHYTTTRAMARRGGAKILSGHPAVDGYGHPLPRKVNTTKKES